jgi:hypothetical protein
VSDALSALVDEIADRVQARIIAALPDLVSRAVPDRVEADFYTERDLAMRFAVNRRTLQAWRLKGEGPQWRKIGKLVRYPAREAAVFFSGRKRANGGG